ncbi:MAG: cupin domain-containing protein [Pyrinomonadaceae bacterium]
MSETIDKTEAELFCTDLDVEIEKRIADGYRLLMIKPADDPSEAVMLKDSSQIRVRTGEKIRSATSEWTIGRAGMMYRDLIPDRLGGRVIASHIRITKGGPVADKVHYHKIDFQVIYCLKGAIKVVYEDQGEPFWLQPGDCVLQPPEIRHRVLEAEAGSEVIEITSPAEHETWFDHEMQLPNAVVNPDRTFGGQPFVLHTTTDSEWKSSAFDGIMASDTKISGVRTLKMTGDSKNRIKITQETSPELLILIDGTGIVANLGKF